MKTSMLKIIFEWLETVKAYEEGYLESTAFTQHYSTLSHASLLNLLSKFEIFLIFTFIQETKPSIFKRSKLEQNIWYEGINIIIIIMIQNLQSFDSIVIL